MRDSAATSSSRTITPRSARRSRCCTRGWPAGRRSLRSPPMPWPQSHRARLPATPGIAHREPDPSAQRRRHRALIRPDRQPAEHPLEGVDAGPLGRRLVSEHAAPVVALEAGALAGEHVLPVQPAVGAADERAILLALAPKERGGVSEADVAAATQMRMPHQPFTVAGGVA